MTDGAVHTPAGLTRRDFLVAMGVGFAAVALPPTAMAVPAGRRTLSGQVAIPLGPGNRHPALFDFTPDKNRCLVACQDTNSLAVVDARTFRLAGTVPLPQGRVPWGVACSPDGRLALVTNTTWDDTAKTFDPGDSTVSVVDLPAGREVGTVPVGSRPNGIVVHGPTNRAFVADLGSDTVSVVDLATRSRVAAIDVGHGPFDVAVSPGAARIVSVNLHDASVSVLDPVRLRRIGDIVVGDATALDPFPEYGPGDPVSAVFVDDDRVWVTNFRSAQLVLVDATTGTVTRRIQLPPSAPVVTTHLTDRYALVSGYGISGLVDLADGRFVADLPSRRVSLRKETSAPPPGVTVPVGPEGLPATHLVWESDADHDEMVVTPVRVPS